MTDLKQTLAAVTVRLTIVGTETDLMIAAAGLGLCVVAVIDNRYVLTPLNLTKEVPYEVVYQQDVRVKPPASCVVVKSYVFTLVAP